MEAAPCSERENESRGEKSGYWVKKTKEDFRRLKKTKK